METKTIFVYCDDKNISEFMGCLYVENIRGKENFSFEFSKNWLEKSGVYSLLDPDLYAFGGRQYLPKNKRLFGIFSDSCPDRWGRMLLDRREVIVSKKEGRKPKKLAESDYLLGVYDIVRTGALRYKTKENGEYLSKDEMFSVPPWVDLSKLEAASLMLEQEENMTNEKWITQLLAPGSSLGGARPKATVRAQNGSLWIAKFPSKYDECNIGAWEIVANNLAKMCELNVPNAKLAKFSDIGNTFLVERFDRIKDKRVYFSSAMTLLGLVDGNDSSEGLGYLDIASFIKSNGACPKEDLLELWKRIVFSISISNTDDHFRNHGFLLTRDGWRLSPIYDVNPNIYGNTLSINITDSDNSLSFELALEVAEKFSLNYEDSKKTIENITKIISDNWTKLGEKYGLKKSAIEYMEPAFNMNYK